MAGSGHVCRSSMLICPHANMTPVRTCRRKNELNGKAQSVILASRARIRTIGGQADGEASLRKCSKRVSNSTGDRTRRGKRAHLARASKKPVQTSPYIFRNRRRVPAPLSAHRHDVPWPRWGLLGSNLARHCQRYAISKPRRHG